MKPNHFFSIRAGVVALAVGTAALLPSQLVAEGEQQFDSPDAAVAALTSAAKAKDTNAVHAIFGPIGHELMSPDVVQASDNFNLFVKRLGEKVQVVALSDSQDILNIGSDGWPFPIPLEKTQDGKWFFNTIAGKEEILNRRIGSDELGAIDVLHAYVHAQREYASHDHNNDEVLEYAQHLMSTPGTHDGLYWPTNGTGVEESPLGPLVAQAHDEGYHRKTGLLTEEQTPY